MITTPQEYNEKLHLIQNSENSKIAILCPNDEKIYKIDLNSRSIESPEFLSVEKDHFAETLYFEMDRFYDHVDLSTTTAIVQFENAKKEPHLYAIPFLDITTKPGKIIFPWCIDGAATASAGTVRYSFKFYHTFKNQGGEVLFDFDLNTRPATGKILIGLDVDKNTEEYKGLADQISAKLDEWAKVEDQLGVDWLIL